MYFKGLEKNSDRLVFGGIYRIVWLAAENMELKPLKRFWTMQFTE